jgi:hypothetical protein
MPAVATVVVLVGGCTGQASAGAPEMAGVSKPAAEPVGTPSSATPGQETMEKVWWDLPKQPGMPADPDWREPARYRFVIESSCNRGAGTDQVEVADGRVVSPSDGSFGPGWPPTLGVLFDHALKSKRDGGESVIVQDPTDGHPVIITINMSAMEFDGAICYRISNYTTDASPVR